MHRPLQLIVDSPWYLAVLAILPAAALSLWLYYRNRRNTDVARRTLILLGSVRFIGIALLGRTQSPGPELRGNPEVNYYIQHPETIWMKIGALH